MWPDDEKAAENTCCIVKGFEEVWTHFCPSKLCLPLSTDTNKVGYSFLFMNDECLVFFLECVSL